MVGTSGRAEALEWLRVGLSEMTAGQVILRIIALISVTMVKTELEEVISSLVIKHLLTSSLSQVQ